MANASFLLMPPLFEDFVRFLLVTPKQEKTYKRFAGVGRVAKESNIEALLRDHPGLSREDLAGAAERASKSRKIGRGDGGHDGSPDDDPPSGRESEERDISDDEADADVAVDAISELADLRAEMLGADVDEGAHFHSILRAGEWWYDKTGHVAREVRGEAETAISSTWAALFRFPPSRTFSLEYYGRESCLQLAAEYCRRGKFFFEMWKASVFSEDFLYTEDDIAPIGDSNVFQTYIVLLDPDDPAVGKAAEIKNLAPAA